MSTASFASGYAAHAHRHQKRKYTGEPYHNHLIDVANIIKIHNFPSHVIQAAYLHDIVEDTDTTFEDLLQDFHPEVVDLVRQVTDISSIADGNRATRKQKDRDHLAKSTSFGASIKLADLISNTSCIVKHDPGFAKVYLAEKQLLLPLLLHGDEALLIKANETLNRGLQTLLEIENDNVT